MNKCEDLRLFSKIQGDVFSTGLTARQGQIIGRGFNEFRGPCSSHFVTCFSIFQFVDGRLFSCWRYSTNGISVAVVEERDIVAHQPA